MYGFDIICLLKSEWSQLKLTGSVRCQFQMQQEGDWLGQALSLIRTYVGVYNKVNQHPSSYAGANAKASEVEVFYTEPFFLRTDKAIIYQ